ncbi:Myb/SANT-like DNA-binding domain protein [Rhynchospora pubera]|uniref:Myb/SANT-like DNA-binding domain protein n=1 Tax=Rhynchospora pubera TaxID=906938 RepID=A0AAV8DYD5_9POAL|nr:Myb/SANT-like DNA-binding domain protein [Rhynchospora pubera]
MEELGITREENGSNEKLVDENQPDEKPLEGGYFTWSKTMDTFLLEVLREQQLKGLKDDRNFQGEAYRIAIKAINAKFNIKITKEKIMNRLKTMKDNMNLGVAALKKSGLTWNNSTKKVQAAPKVWDDLIKANPRMRKIRDKEILNFELLCDIFEKERAHGEPASTAKEMLKNWDKEPITIDEVDQLQAENVVVLDSENVNFGTQNGVSNGASPSTKNLKKSASKLGVKRKYEDVDLTCADSKIASNPVEEGLKNATMSMNEIARQLAVANECFMKSNSRVYSGAEIYAELKRIGVPSDKMIGTVRLLKSDKEELDNFFGFPDEHKRDWLLQHDVDCDPPKY